MRNVTVTFKSDLKTIEISKILEAMFWDGEHFEDFEDVDWEIN
jgi:hypothetical protein